MEVILFVVVFYVAYRVLKFLDAKAREKAEDQYSEGVTLSSAIKTRWHMSEAAVVIQNLLERYAKLGLSEINNAPMNTANQLVAAAWDKMPDVLNGNAGVRPHKLAIAAVALANGFQIYEDNRSVRSSLFWALAEVLKETEANASAYRFNKLDQLVLSKAMTEFIVESKRVERSSVISGLSNP